MSPERLELHAARSAWVRAEAEYAALRLLPGSVPNYGRALAAALGRRLRAEAMLCEARAVVRDS